MPKHNHHCECEHGNLAYCKKCDTAYCLDCKQEWKPPCTQSHGWYTWPSITTPQWSWTTARGAGDQIPCDTNSTNEITFDTSDVTMHSGVSHANCG